MENSYDPSREAAKDSIHDIGTPKKESTQFDKSEQEYLEQNPEHYPHDVYLAHRDPVIIFRLYMTIGIIATIVALILVLLLKDEGVPEDYEIIGESNSISVLETSHGGKYV